jgi:GDP-L-fucose synthase
MMRKFRGERKTLSNPLGKGTPMREFLFVDDMAQAVVFALENTLRILFIQRRTGEDLTSNNWLKLSKITDTKEKLDSKPMVHLEN